MLKSQLEEKLKEAEENVLHLAKRNGELTRSVGTKDEEIKELIKTIRFNDGQLKQLSQSIYTMLQVKYPDKQSEEISEEERFLIFLHGLCADRDYNMNSVSDVFRHMS